MGKLWFFISCSIRPTCIPYLKFYFMIYNFFFLILLQDTSCWSQLSAEVWPGNNLQYFINEVRFDMSDYSM